MTMNIFSLLAYLMSFLKIGTTHIVSICNFFTKKSNFTKSNGIEHRLSCRHVDSSICSVTLVYVSMWKSEPSALNYVLIMKIVRWMFTHRKMIWLGECVIIAISVCREHENSSKIHIFQPSMNNSMGNIWSLQIQCQILTQPDAIDFSRSND